VTWMGSVVDEASSWSETGISCLTSAVFSVSVDLESCGDPGVKRAGCQMESNVVAGATGRQKTAGDRDVRLTVHKEVAGMRRKHLVQAAFLLLAALAIGGSVGFGQALCEFVMPESTIQMATASFSYRHYDDGRTPEVDSSGGRVDARFERLYDSPDLGYTMSAATQLDLDTWVASSWLASGVMSYRYYYAQELPLFAYAGVTIDTATYYRQPGCEIRAGVGIGRFRDVTPMARTLRIMDALSRSGNIKKAVSSQAMLRIADLIARSDGFDEAEAYVAAVAEMIASSVGGPLDSVGVLAVQTELEQEADERYCGAILQTGVGYELVDPNGETEDILYVFSGDVGRALTPDSQIRCRLSWSGASGDFLGENTSLLEVTYEAKQPDGNGVKGTYSVRRAAAGDRGAVTSQAATVAYTLDLAGSDMILGLALSRETGDPKWTIDLSVSVALALL
jgi:hypothetical protein